MDKRASELHDDPLSAASAGLVALGVDRAQRIDTLDVLAFLIDHADASGAVVLDHDLFAQEEAFGVDKCLSAYALLEQLHVVLRTERGWTIPNIAAHNGPGGQTAASLAVLRKHLASVGHQAATADAARTPLREAPIAAVGDARLTPVRRLRRALPLTVGLAASAATIAGLAQFVPQAAVAGRNAAQSSKVVTSAARSVATTAAGKAKATAPTTLPIVRDGAPTGLAAAATSVPPAPSEACITPKVIAAVTSVGVVRLGAGGESGSGAWAAVVNGTATLTDSESALLLPALHVVAHGVGGDTNPVTATLESPLLRPNTATSFHAIVALGSIEPTQAITATATPVGVPSC